jgi:uncharacterized DUF497 family protein
MSSVGQGLFSYLTTVAGPLYYVTTKRGGGMPRVDVIWTDENETHIVEGGVAVADVEHVVRNPVGSGVSRSNGRPFVVGYTPDDRKLIVVYEEIDAMTVYPITAYELKD